MKYLLFFLVGMLGLSAFSQYTEIINSKRPGFSESPYGVGTGVYQIEAGYFYGTNNSFDFFTTRKTRGIDLFLRTGLLFEKLEVNVDFKYQKDDKLANTVTGGTFPVSGISRFTVGAKYLFYMPKYKDPSEEIRSWKKKWAFDWKRLVPSVGLYVGLNTNFLSAPYKKPSITPKAVLLLQHDFSKDLILVTNVVGDHLNLQNRRTLGYIVTLTYAITPKFSIFGETQGMFTRYTKKYELGGGLAYLFSKNLQVGVNVHSRVEFKYVDIYGGVGLSWRLDLHRDKLIRTINEEEDGSGKIRSKEGGFFKRLFKKKKRRGRK